VRYALDQCDRSANINFFLYAPVTPESQLTFAEGSSEPGRYVELRAGTDVIALLSNCPQLNNPCNAYNPTPIRVMIVKHFSESSRAATILESVVCISTDSHALGISGNLP
jgi:uncharacterized protein YcgI (DUF1989 family)